MFHFLSLIEYLIAANKIIRKNLCVKFLYYDFCIKFATNYLPPGSAGFKH